MRWTSARALVALVALAIGTAAPSRACCASEPHHLSEIYTLAGIGPFAGELPVGGFRGDGGPGGLAELNAPAGIAVTSHSGVLIADAANHRVRMVDARGVITTVAGSGKRGFSGDNGPARRARLDFPVDVVAQPGGGMLIVDSQNQRIRRVDRHGIITTVAGTGHAGFSGDGGPAVRAALSYPTAVAALTSGGFLVADSGNQRVRLVTPAGTITTVAGSGRAGFGGDGGPATRASLHGPGGIVPLPGGGFVFTDVANQRVREVSPAGVISTVAGSGLEGFGGDGGPASKARFDRPIGLARLPTGGLLIADSANNRIRELDVHGRIHTFLGGGIAGDFQGDGQPLNAARLTTPDDVAVTADGSVVVADTDNNTVRVASSGHRRWLGVAIVPRSVEVPLGRCIRVRLAVTSGAQLRFRLARRLGGVPLFERRVRTDGSAVVAACRRLEPGTYLLVVTARSGRRIAAALGSLDVNPTRGGRGRMTLETLM